jgi:hypothetical protein
VSTLKHWTYVEMTGTAEELIRSLMRQASSTSDQGRAHDLQCMAKGVLVAWQAITTGSQREGDNARLHAMTTGSGRSPKL